MSLLVRYAWGIFIFSSLISACRIRRRIQPGINANGSMRSGYLKIITGRFILVTLPWIVVAFDVATGKVNDIIDFLYPRQFKPAVISLHLLLLAEVAVISYWIFFSNGARYLKKYSGSFRYSKNGIIVADQSTEEIKKEFFSGIAIFLFILLMIWVLPIPHIQF